MSVTEITESSEFSCLPCIRIMQILLYYISIEIPVLVTCKVSLSLMLTIKGFIANVQGYPQTWSGIHFRTYMLVYLLMCLWWYFVWAILLHSQIR